MFVAIPRLEARGGASKPDSRDSFTLLAYITELHCFPNARNLLPFTDHSSLSTRVMFACSLWYLSLPLTLMRTNEEGTARCKQSSAADAPKLYLLMMAVCW